MWTTAITAETHPSQTKFHRHLPNSTNPISERLMTVHFLPPAFDRYDAVVEDAIATCNGDLRGALKALIIANEFLEKDLLKLTSGQTDAANKSMKD